MAENTTIRESFFDSLAKGAKWDVGVSINRTNPLPLDQYSVFKSETELDAYIAGAFAYPGQIVAVVGEDETVVYYLDQDKVKQEVGSMPGVDGKSIKIEVDENGDEYLTLVGLADAKAGASLVKGADGSIGWSTTTQSELNADLEEIKGDITGLENTVYGYTDEETKEVIPGHDDRIAELEAKFDSLGGIFNYKGAIEVGVDETINDKIDFVPVSGDVIIVNGSQEYVYADGKWEPFGDPHGVEAIDDRVSTLEEKIDGYTVEVDGVTTNVPGLIEKVADIKTEIGVKAEGETAASGIYDYIDTKAATAQSNAEATAKDYTDGQIDLVEAEVAKKADGQATTDALALKADITYVDGQIDLVEAEVAKKADDKATTDALNLKADKTALESGLALKADKEETNQAISGLDTRLTTAEGDIDKLEAAVGADGLAGRVSALETTDQNHQTAINGLTSNLGTLAGAEAGTAFGEAAAAKAAAGAAQETANTGVANALAAQNAADQAQADATKALGDAKAASELAATKATIDEVKGLGYALDTDAQKYAKDVQGDTTETVASAYALANTANVKANEAAGAASAAQSTADQGVADAAEAKGIADAADALSKENKAKFDNYTTTVDMNKAIAAVVATEGGDTKESATVAGAKLYTDDKVDAVNKTIKDINDKLVDLTTVMNFIGKSSTDPSTGTVTISGEVITPQLGDVVVFESFEYVYTGEADGWEIFGNVTADETRFSNLEDRAEALEGRMDTAEADIDDLQPRMTQAEADIDAVEAKIPVIEGDIDNLEGRMTQAETDIDAVEARALVLENAINDTEDAEGNTVKGIASRLTAVEGVAGDAATAKSLEDEVKRATERENEIAKAVTDNKAAQDEINEGFEANIDAITNELTGLLAWGTF